MLKSETRERREMRKLKKLSVLAVVVFAFSAIGVANASAAPSFTTSKAGAALTGTAKGSQVFTTNAGTVTCTSAATKGTTAASGSTTQKVFVKYSGCTAFGFASVNISEAEYIFNAKAENKNTVTINKAIKIEVPLAGCSQTVPAGQTVGTVSFSPANVLTTALVEESNVSGITYTSSGGLCGASGSNGTYKGNNEVKPESGVTIGYDSL